MLRYRTPRFSFRFFTLAEVITRDTHIDIFQTWRRKYLPSVDHHDCLSEDDGPHSKREHGIDGTPHSEEAHVEYTVERDRQVRINALENWYLASTQEVIYAEQMY